MKMMRIGLLVILLISGFAITDQAAAAGDSGRRQELAVQMNERRPASAQVDIAIRQIAEQLPESDRDGFITFMKNNLDYKAIENISIDAMAETFTVEELEAMVEYYSKPEALSASEKLPEYQKKVSPEITRMIDKVMMKARTGGN